MSAELAPLFTKGINKHYWLESSDLEAESCIPKIFHTGEMDSAYLDDQLWENYGPPAFRMPLETPVMGSFKPSFGKRYIAMNVGLGDVFAKEDVDDDVYGVLNRFIPAKGGALARSFATFKEVQAANMFALLGYTSATVAESPDGKSLFNTAHPISSSQIGATFSNRASVDIDISISGINSCRNAMVSTPASNNYQILQGNVPKILVCNPSQGAVAWQAVNGQMERGTADNNDNYVKRMKIQVVEWAYFRAGGTVGAANGIWNAWFVLGGTHYLKFLMRENFNAQSVYKPEVNGYLVLAYMRFALGWTDWRGTWGSRGG